MGEAYYHSSNKLPQRCEKKIWTQILNCTGSLSGALTYWLDFLPIFTDQPVFKISSTDPVQLTYSLKVWSGECQFQAQKEYFCDILTDVFNVLLLFHVHTTLVFPQWLLTTHSCSITISYLCGSQNKQSLAQVKERHSSMMISLITSLQINCQRLKSRS